MMMTKARPPPYLRIHLKACSMASGESGPELWKPTGACSHAMVSARACLFLRQVHNVMLAGNCRALSLPNSGHSSC